MDQHSMEQRRRRNHLDRAVVIYLVMTMEAKTTDSTDPELEMSSGGTGLGELLSYQLYPVITTTQAQCQGSLSSPLYNVKC